MEFDDLQFFVIANIDSKSPHRAHGSCFIRRIVYFGNVRDAMISQARICFEFITTPGEEPTKKNQLDDAHFGGEINEFIVTLEQY
jgi:hypothetical protein